MPDPTDDTKADECSRAKGKATPRSWRLGCLFWLAVWCGTAMAGGAFGFLIGCGVNTPSDCIRASFLGVVVAAISGALTISTVAIVTWCFWLSRFRSIMGGLAGGFTLIYATLCIPGEPSWPSALAGLLGTLRGGLAGFWYHSRAKAKGLVHSPQYHWRFTLRDLFIRVTAISTLLAVWILAINGVIQTRKDFERHPCKMNLDYLGYLLREYQETHGVLPPAYVADEDGHPLLSWRVLVAGCDCYNDDLKTTVDFSQSWNGSTNLPFLNSLDTDWLQCPSSKQTKTGVTHYVAVAGPGTLWDKNEASRLSESDKRILVIEWPESDIHWAEPRDITVDELMAWLESKPDTNHPDSLLYVNGAGEVKTLPTDSDPETVRKLVVGETAQ